MKNFKEKAVVLLSGGMDSLVTAGLAALEYEPAMLHINYGQRTESKELWSFEKICKHYNAKEKLVADISHLAMIGGSSLTDTNIAVTKGNHKKDEIPTSYVPFRNANFLSIAVSWAEIIGARKIFIGAVEEDSSGYPDCTKVFFDAFNNAVRYGTKPSTDIEIVTPVIDMKKFEIVKRGYELNVPFEYSWSCYKNNDVACGECDSCTLRIKAFTMAGIEDPIEYKIKPNFSNKF